MLFHIKSAQEKYWLEQAYYDNTCEAWQRIRQVPRKRRWFALDWGSLDRSQTEEQVYVSASISLIEYWQRVVFTMRGDDVCGCLIDNSAIELVGSEEDMPLNNENWSCLKLDKDSGSLRPHRWLQKSAPSTTNVNNIDSVKQSRQKRTQIEE